MAEIGLAGLEKTYPDGTRAVEPLDLEIRDGEFVVFVGPSGCGKTSVLRMVAGLEEISGGEIRIGGRVVNHLLPKERDIAMVFQNYALYPHMDVFDNMAFGLRQRRLPKEEIERRVLWASRTLGLEETLRKKPRTLVRRSAPARRDGPRDRARAAGVPDGRAAVEPRREAARRDARRDPAHPAQPRRRRRSTSRTTRPRR